MRLGSAPYLISPPVIYLPVEFLSLRRFSEEALLIESEQLCEKTREKLTRLIP
jgi:hypothetical protein